MNNQVVPIIKTKPIVLVQWQPLVIGAALMILLATSLASAQGRQSGYVDGATTCPVLSGDRVCRRGEGPWRRIGEGANGFDGIGVAPGGMLSIKGLVPGFDGLYREAVFVNRGMEIRAEGGPVTISPRPLAPFDLVADKLDANGVPLNPKWGGQLLTSRPPDPGTPPDPTQCPLRPNPSPCLPFHCDRTYPDAGVFPCTNQFTYKDYGDFCGPHINWFGATYMGCVEWGDHHTDDDYSIRIRRPDLAGYTPANSYLKSEFDAGETANHFATPWWNIFHSIVENGSTGRERAQEMLGYRKSVIATGLMGIDIEHGPHVELHPIWALAMNVEPYLFNVRPQFVYELNGGQVSPALAEQFRIHDWPLTPPIRVEVVRTGIEWKIIDARTSFTVWNDGRVRVLWVHGQLAPDNDTWAFFVRNWGDQGACSDKQKFVTFPNNRYTFRLPWRSGATDVRVIPGQAIALAYRIQNPAWSITKVPGQAVIVTFDLEAPKGNGSLYEGELHLQWIGSNVTIPPCAEFSKRANSEEAEYVGREEDEYAEREEAEYAALKKKAQENVKWEGIRVTPRLDSSVY